MANSRILLMAAVLLTTAASAQEAPKRASEPERVAAFLTRADSGVRSFVSDNANDRALQGVALEWASEGDSRRVSNLAAFAIPGSTGERRLIAALSKWTGKGRITDEAKESVKAFLNDAAAQAERLSGDATVKKEIDAAVAQADQTAAIERARNLGQQKRGNGAALFGPEKQVQGFEASGGQTAFTAGSRGQAAGNVATTTGFAPAKSAIVAGGGTNASPTSAIDSIPPAGNPVPLNFRNRKVFEVPSPVESSANPVPGVTSAGGVGSVGAGSAQDPAKTAVPAEDSSDAKPRAVFAATVARLEREGKRRPGKGGMNGLVNNVKASLAPGSTYIRCYDQAEELLGDLDKAISPKSGWTFRMTTYTGEGHEANGHYWVTGVSKNKDTPSLIMDPWLGEIRTDPSKNPIAIKPFFPWLMGATMDKIVPN